MALSFGCAFLVLAAAPLTAREKIDHSDGQFMSSAYLVWGAECKGGLTESRTMGDLSSPCSPPVDGLPDLANVRLAHQRYSDGKTPRLMGEADINFPQNTGHASIDRVLKNEAEKRFQAAVSDLKTLSEDDYDQWPEDIEKPTVSYSSVYFIYQPSAKYISILFFDHNMYGGAHNDWAYRAYTFDLTTGRALTEEDLFAEPAGLGRFQAAPDWCGKYPDRGPCRRQAEGVDPWHSPDLRSMVFTPEGVAVIIGPYVAGDYMDGTKVIDLPKEQLIGLGFKPVFWAQ